MDREKKKSRLQRNNMASKYASTPPPTHPPMAFATSFLLLPISVLAIPLIIISKPSEAMGCYTSIISFGDSFADTGNFVISGSNTSSAFGRLPYGETYFHRDSGRFSDGRLVIDFIAEALGLPSVPYLAGPGSYGFQQGVNFAVGGATALDVSFLTKRGIAVTLTNDSWSVQMKWFKQLRPSLCSSKSVCKEIFGRSLIFVGEIGGNDYNFAIQQRVNLNEIQTFVPKIIRAISSTIHVLIKLGAMTLVAPGTIPIGCSSAYLTAFSSPSSSKEGDSDPTTRCVKWANELMEYHNHKLLNELDRIRRQHPHVTIIYADYYEAIMNILRSPQKFGFLEPFVACCGGGGPYNVNQSVPCGNQGATVCKDPSKYINWDGIHPTEAVYKIVSIGFLEGPYATPPIAHACQKIN